ncbi:hypothetical protein [Siphonobacter sp. SORGH_AS_0500]|uniref:hypothetical protein n=1 Tax=Siphonobacter sp. SORGH_AS_0500 TaxID=1864824 RepID=UPI00285D2A45|nr:hypothetical protein [Siphonobacter sp. SORGH_AS_0500]MDR6196161.1 chromosome segregation ATPase [Siphonobacter sp. SORGH_AS_0500]
MAEKTKAELQEELDSAIVQINSLTSLVNAKDDKIASLTSDLDKVTSEKNNLSTSLDVANVQIKSLEATNSEYETLLEEAATETKVIAVTDPVIEYEGKQYRALRKAFWLAGESLPVRFDKLSESQKLILIEAGKLELLK